VKESYRKGCVVAAPYLVNHLVELRYFRQVGVLSTAIDDKSEASVVTTAVYELTDLGKRFSRKWKF